VLLPATSDLFTGWNIMSYPETADENALTVMDSLISQGFLVKVQDETGAAIEYLPTPVDRWIDHIVTFNPGEGYKVKVNGYTPITIHESTLKSEIISLPERLDPEYFKLSYNGNGMDHMNIYLINPTINGNHLEAGDEIAVFDGEICVGACRIGDNFDEYISVSVTRDDPSTGNKDGFKNGNMISFKVWKVSHQVLIENIKVDYIEGYNELFQGSGTTILRLDAINSGTFTDDLGKPLTGLGDNYPNPFNRSTWIEYTLSDEMNVTIAVYDILGRKLKVLIDEHMTAGTHKVLWDGQDDQENRMKQGIYFYEMKTGDYSGVKSMYIVY